MGEVALFIIELASLISSIGVLITFFCKPIREKIFNTKRTIEGEKCLLRSEILRIYYRDLDKKEIRQYEFENFIKLYEAYKSLNGNSFVDAIAEEIQTWKIVS